MKGRIGFLIFLLIFPAIVYFHLPKYSFEVNLWPTVMGTVLLVLVVAQIFKEPRLKSEEQCISIDTGKAMEQRTFRQLIVPALWIIVTFPMVYILGFTVTIFLYSFLYIRLHKQSWIASIVIPAVTTGVVYFIFIMTLKFRLYEGLLFRFM